MRGLGDSQFDIEFQLIFRFQENLPNPGKKQFSDVW